MWYLYKQSFSHFMAKLSFLSRIALILVATCFLRVLWAVSLHSIVSKLSNSFIRSSPHFLDSIFSFLCSGASSAINSLLLLIKLSRWDSTSSAHLSILSRTSITGSTCWEVRTVQSILLPLGILACFIVLWSSTSSNFPLQKRSWALGLMWNFVCIFSFNS